MISKIFSSRCFIWTYLGCFYDTKLGGCWYCQTDLNKTKSLDWPCFRTRFSPTRWTKKEPSCSTGVTSSGWYCWMDPNKAYTKTHSLYWPCFKPDFRCRHIVLKCVLPLSPVPILPVCLHILLITFASPYWVDKTGGKEATRRHSSH